MVDFDKTADHASDELDAMLRMVRGQTVRPAAVDDLRRRLELVQSFWKAAVQNYERWFARTEQAIDELDRAASRSGGRPPPGAPPVRSASYVPPHPLPRPGIDYATPRGYGNPSTSGAYQGRISPVAPPERPMRIVDLDGKLPPRPNPLDRPLFDSDAFARAQARRRRYP